MSKLTYFNFYLSSCRSTVNRLIPNRFRNGQNSHFLHKRSELGDKVPFGFSGQKRKEAKKSWFSVVTTSSESSTSSPSSSQSQFSPPGSGSAKMQLPSANVSSTNQSWFLESSSCSSQSQVSSALVAVSLASSGFTCSRCSFSFSSDSLSQSSHSPSLTVAPARLYPIEGIRSIMSAITPIGCRNVSPMLKIGNGSGVV